MAQLANDAIKGFSDEYTFDTSIVQVFPSLASVTAKSALATPLCGCYCWTDEFGTWYHISNDLGDVGFHWLRIGNGALDSPTVAEFTGMMTFCEDYNGKILWPMSVNPRTSYGSDAEMLTAFNTELGAKLAAYGPDGTFWDDNPTVPYHPITDIEFFNEPNDSSWFWGSYPNTDELKLACSDLYARIVISGYDYIRANSDWDGISITAGAVSKGGLQYLTTGECFEKCVFDAIVAHSRTVSSCMNFWSNHPYAQIDYPPDTEKYHGVSNHDSLVNSANEIRAQLDAFGATGVGIRFTEYGWYQSDGHYLPTTGNSWDPSVTGYQKAAYVLRYYMMAMRMGIDLVTIMFDTDSAEPFNGGFLNCNFGSPITYTLYDSGTATKNYNTLLPNPKIVTAISDGTNGYYAYELEPDANNPSDSHIIAIWNVAGSTSKSLTLPAKDYTVYDMLGSTEVIASDGELDLTIGPYPIFVTGVESSDANPWVMIYG